MVLSKNLVSLLWLMGFGKSAQRLFTFFGCVQCWRVQSLVLFVFTLCNSGVFTAFRGRGPQHNGVSVVTKQIIYPVMCFIVMLFVYLYHDTFVLVRSVSAELIKLEVNWR